MFPLLKYGAAHKPIVLQVVSFSILLLFAVVVLHSVSPAWWWPGARQHLGSGRPEPGHQPRPHLQPPGEGFMLSNFDNNVYVHRNIASYSVQDRRQVWALMPIFDAGFAIRQPMAIKCQGTVISAAACAVLGQPTQMQAFGKQQCPSHMLSYHDLWLACSHKFTGWQKWQ